MKRESSVFGSVSFFLDLHLSILGFHFLSYQYLSDVFYPFSGELRSGNMDRVR